MPDEYDKQSLTRLIDASYELEDEYFGRLSDAKDEQASAKIKAEFENKKQEISIKFQKLADFLFKNNAFDTKEQARKAITSDPNDRMYFLGPDGVVPDDGTLNPEHEVDGLLALMNGSEFHFQVPVAYLRSGPELTVEFERNKLDAPSLSALRVRLTSNYSSLRAFDVVGPFNLGPRQKSQNRLRHENWIWVEGSLHGKNFQRVKLFVEALCQEIQGALLASELCKFELTHLISPPEMLIGSGATFNIGSYVHSIVSGVAYSVSYSPSLTSEGELDMREGLGRPLGRRIRQLERLFRGEDDRAREIRQALRMYLRAHAAWSEGEKAMFLATLLEGLLLDRRKEDLSARLQDAVAYWVGTTAIDRDGIRAQIKKLYSARSDFVHNGQLTPSNFDAGKVLALAQRVIEKEIVNL